MKSNPPEYKFFLPKEHKEPRDLTESRDYLYIGPDSLGRMIYSLKSLPGVYYAVVEAMKIAWRVSAVKPSTEMDPKYKKKRGARLATCRADSAKKARRSPPTRDRG